MNENETEVVADELSALKARADLLGISYHPSIGLEKLREKVNAVVTSEDKPVEPKTAKDKQKKQFEDAMRLVRIRLTCMNPAKTEWPGDIFTVSNAVVGTTKKYIPFNAEDGWHVPHIMYEYLRDKQCQIFVKGKTRNGVITRTSKLIKEFAIEVLPDLTKEELAELSRVQAAARGLE